jgi:hypothetical protein
MNVSFRQTTRNRTNRSQCRSTLGFAGFEDTACRCHFCSNEFRYPAFRAGEILICPFCGMETMSKTSDPHGRKSFSAEEFRIEVGELEWLPGPLGVRYIAGNLFSHAGEELCWVKVEVELYDDSAALLGRASDHRRRLAPGQIWHFKVPVLKPSASRALLFDVTCEFGSIYSPGDWTGSTCAVWRSVIWAGGNAEHRVLSVSRQ